MANLVVLGTQWGDEGKGKIVDLLTASFDVVARYQGGHNAGHTVFVDGQKIILHLLPTGILHPGKLCVIGNGVVIDPKAFLDEIEALKAIGVNVDHNILISRNAHIIIWFQGSKYCIWMPSFIQYIQHFSRFDFVSLSYNDYLFWYRKHEVKYTEPVTESKRICLNELLNGFDNVKCFFFMVGATCQPCQFEQAMYCGGGTRWKNTFMHCQRSYD